MAQKLGFVGYGAMASRMGKRLADAGWEVLAFAPGHEPGEDAHDIRYLKTAAALAAEVHTILVSVPDDAALDQAASGEDGFLAGARSGSLLIDVSSVSPSASIALSRRGAAQELAVLDAPVSGSTPEAEQGKLVVLVGGAAADVERAQPIFSVIGARTVHAGAAGQGSTLKLVVNGIMGAGLAALAEAIGYGLAAGLDRDVLYGALDGAAILSPHHTRKLNAARDADFAPQFPTALMDKDMGLLLADANAAGMPAPTLAAAAQSLTLSHPAHDGDDYSALIGVMEHLAAKRR
ncbi:NAD(P)-dependent oxidoreductase [Lichenicoccus sp.]|uniref:NAD(P)-dependent oxidoreductase n=1 Tax=Lichenicoccus sp. TaxID=2781899 RepID=UPI003D0C5818